MVVSECVAELVRSKETARGVRTIIITVQHDRCSRDRPIVPSAASAQPDSLLECQDSSIPTDHDLSRAHDAHAVTRGDCLAADGGELIEPAIGQQDIIGFDKR